MGNKINNKLIMLFTKDVDKFKQIINLCMRLDIRTRKIKPSDINLEIGSLAGIKTSGAKKTVNKAPIGYEMPEVMIFSGISNESLDIFLEEYKKAGITPIALKAVLTPYNVKWSLYELIAELQRERIQMMFGKELNS